jgi:hypothetical protein
MKEKPSFADLSCQSWLNRPTSAELERACSRCFSIAVAGWTVAAVFAGLFLWVIATR